MEIQPGATITSSITRTIDTPCSSCRLTIGLARPLLDAREDGLDGLRVLETRGDDRYDDEDIDRWNE